MSGFCQNCSIKLIKHFGLETRVNVENKLKRPRPSSSSSGIEIGNSTKFNRKAAVVVGMFALVALACFMGSQNQFATN